MNLKKPVFFIFFFIASFSTHAQDAISFDSLQFQYSFLTDDAIYFNSNKLVKIDYSGHVIWSKSGNITGQAIKVEENGIYSFQSSSVTKLDTSGNLLWSKEFITPVCSMLTEPNYIADIVVNKNRIYVLTNQSPHSIGLYFPSLITLDTSGAIINVWCGNNYQNSNFTTGVKRLDGGAWLVSTYYGSLQTCTTFSVDTMGNINQSSAGAYLQSEQITYVQAVISNHSTLHTYLLNSSFPGYAREPFLVFENDNGNGFTFKGYQIPSLNWGMMLLAGANDTFDNLYILARTDDQETILFKTNPIGDVLIAKMWPLYLLNTYGINFPLYYDYVKMIHRNDSLYITTIINGKTSILTFDDSLNSSCYPAGQNLTMTDNPDMITGSGILSYPVLHVTNNPAVLSPQLQNISQPNGVNVCFQNSIKEDESGIYASVYPNPCDNQLSINYSGSTIDYKVYTLEGTVIHVPSENSNEKINLNTSTIMSGMYILIGKIGDKQFRKIISIQH